MRLPTLSSSFQSGAVVLGACVLSGLLFCPSATSQGVDATGDLAAPISASQQWEMIAQHLPDPATSTPQLLEQQADILRARRFPEEALKYYNYALQRGGNRVKIMNKLGLAQLEMRNTALAKAYFERAVKLDKKDSDAWNNLGAVDFLQRQSSDAISAYKKAVKLKKREAVYHANLGTAYFDSKDYRAARREMTLAMKLDPLVFEHDVNGAGVAAHVLSSEERARMSYEMAKLYAEHGESEKMWHSLAMAIEAGMDVQREMKKDAALAPFATAPQMLVLIHNAEALKASHGTTANAAGTLPNLGDVKPASGESKAVVE